MSVFPFRALARYRSRSDWFELDEGYQAMLPGTGGQTTRTCAKDSNVAKLEENRRVYWLPGSAAESTDGAPLSMKFRVARLVVEATTDSETDFDVNATQLEESEETRRLKHDEQGQTRHVRLHIFSPGHGVERQWIRHTDLRQARTRVKTGEGRIISSRQTQIQYK